ncbi:MAG: tetratricopeptide repeat protein [Gammaproteobacteria bacterium]|nr:tetratricopeptide repeat protein [Gammaproteobacteria bacterium]
MGIVGQIYTRLLGKSPGSEKPSEPTPDQKTKEEQALIDLFFKRHADLDRLLWVINQGDGFSMYFARCNVPEYRKRLTAALILECERPVMQLDLRETDFDPTQVLVDEVLHKHLQEAPQDAALFLYGLDKLLPAKDEEQQHRTLQQLNWRRSAYARLNRTLVIWLSDDALTLLSRGAPDFYDWYSGFYEFDVPETDRPHLTEKSLETYKAGRVHPGERLSKEEKHKLIHDLRGLLEETSETGREVLGQLHDLAWLYKSLGEYSQALEYDQKVLKLAQEMGDRQIEAATFHNIGTVYSLLNDYDKALENLEKALHLKHETGQLKDWAATLTFIGSIHFIRGDYDTALDDYQQALEIHQKFADRWWEKNTLFSIGQIHDAHGDYDVAREHYQHALEISRELGDRQGEADSLHAVGNIHEAHGEYDPALEYYQKSLEISRELGSRRGEGASLRAIGNIHEARGEYDSALEYYQKSLEICRELGSRADEAATRRGIAKIHLARQEWETAREHLQAARAVQEELKLPAALSRTLFVLGEFHWAQGEKEEAQAQWREAGRIAREIGYARTLRDLERKAEELDE